MSENAPEKLEILSDPYSEIDDESKQRIGSDVPTNVKKRFQSVCPNRGILQAMVNHFLKSVFDEMEQKGIILYEPEQYKQFIDIIRRRTAPWTNQHGPSSVGSPPAGGTSQEAQRVSSQSENAKTVPPNPKGKSRKGVKSETREEGKAG